MENWQIHSLPGACSTTYKLLYSEADLAFVLICGSVGFVCVMALLWSGWHAHPQKTLFLFLVSAGFFGVIVYFEWQEYQMDQDIRQHIVTAPGTILSVGRSGGKNTLYEGQYCFWYGGYQYYGLVQLPIQNVSSYEQYYTNKQYTILFSKLNPNNSKLDIDCPAGSAE
ncbi:hypothetical protein KBK19_12475 [Microvirga sp. STR05]|uniref:DUF3592 domain-containing protein n=1 Tax=Hymenobacter duratus TaxID=2771356 RepID=A0ABR8JG64_9BACT|nr:hypothetical protein [Hymenobacter duratus]MBD2715852.1 hypothetical protein [Hymenobacter duratus]MBR7950763.1 hypothetical protein [Microvirga sp. STR05]